jgi:uncharacterized membrane protein
MDGFDKRKLMTWKDFLIWAAVRIMFLSIYLLVGLLFAALGRPLMRRKISPNAFYGYRVGKTLNDPRVWYDANEYCGRCFFWYGVTLAVCGIVLFCIPVVDALAYAVTLPVAICLGLVVCMVLSSLYLDKITKP